jgi:hypothetical protein
MVTETLQPVLFPPLIEPLSPPTPCAYLCPGCVLAPPRGGAATQRLLAGKGLVSCVRRRQLLTQLWTVRGGGRSPALPGLPGAGAASWTASGCPFGLELAPSVSCLLGLSGHPHRTSWIPSLKAKVRLGLYVGPQNGSFKARLGTEFSLGPEDQAGV